ncbi:MAG: hypothetical protein K2N87_05995 [Eubacterium sp.]|nr:hypothetical protein [Eubacterium sp.]
MPWHLNWKRNAGRTKNRKLEREDRLKRYLYGSMLESGNQKQQKEIVQELISDIAHQTLTPTAK